MFISFKQNVMLNCKGKIYKGKEVHLDINVCRISYILTRTHAKFSDLPRQDTGPGILWSVNRWTKPERNTYAKYLDRANLVINYQKLKKMDRPLDPFY